MMCRNLGIIWGWLGLGLIHVSKWRLGSQTIYPEHELLGVTVYTLQSNQTIFTSTNTFFPINPLLWVDIIMIEIKQKYGKIIEK